MAMCIGQIWANSCAQGVLLMRTGTMCSMLKGHPRRSDRRITAYVHWPGFVIHAFVTYPFHYLAAISFFLPATIDQYGCWVLWLSMHEQGILPMQTNPNQSQSLVTQIYLWALMLPVVEHSTVLIQVGTEKKPQICNVTRLTTQRWILIQSKQFRGALLSARINLDPKRHLYQKHITPTEHTYPMWHSATYPVSGSGHPKRNGID